MSTPNPPRVRARELGVNIGRFEPGPWNTITDVSGVRVGFTTLISGAGALQTGEGPVRTGVTVIQPHEGDIGSDPVFAGVHVLNGNGEMTGTIWIEESGLLTSPIAITNTHSVGVVRDATISYEAEREDRPAVYWGLPVVAETYDGWLNDINGMHVKPEHVWSALDNAASGPVAEGCVGGGTGMICHEFKGGTGTSSRKLPDEFGGWTVGVLVQANYGHRHLLRIDGIPAGQLLPRTMTDPAEQQRLDTGEGSIIIIVATDAPLMPHQCKRLAQRATIGLARAGGTGSDSSGDIFLAFATGNRGLGGYSHDSDADLTQPVATTMLLNAAMTPLFEACADATEEAILNAMCMAEPMTGIDDRFIPALPLAEVRRMVEARNAAFGL